MYVGEGLRSERRSAMDWIVFLCLLSTVCLRCDSADPLVTLYGASSVGQCTENGGEISGGREATFIGNYSSLQDALDQLNGPKLEFSHYTLCLRGGANYSISSTFIITSSVAIIGTGNSAEDSDKDKVAMVYCNYDHIANGASHTIYFNRSDEVRMENLQFERCSSPFRLELVQSVVIFHCSFKFFTEAVLDIFNCRHTVINESLFQHNSGSGLSTESSRGNTGAVAFGFREPLDNFTGNDAVFEVLNTSFINNSAFTTSLDAAFRSNVYPGRGGGLGIFLSHNFEYISVIIADCLFHGNFADATGGAVFFVITEDNVQDNVYFRDTVFDSNFGNMGASGVQLSYIARSTQSNMPVTFNIANCVFSNHTGHAGGALSVFPSFFGGGGSNVIVVNSTFVGNHENTDNPFSYGSAIGISEINVFDDRSTLPKHEIIDCTFLNNSGKNGIFNNGYAPVKFSGTNRFIGNRGTPLKVVGALVEFTGRLEFINNTVPNGASLYFTSFSQARINQGLRMWFEGNVGRFGASLFVDNPTIPIFNTDQLHNPLCFLLYEDLSPPPTNWNNVTITSTRNSAIEGSSLYIRRLEPCAWTSFSPPYFNLTSVRDWPIWDIRSDNNNFGFKGDIKTDAQKLTVTTSQVSSWPNQYFPVTVSVLDQFDLPTAITTQYLYSSNNVLSEEKVLLQPELEVITSQEEFTQNFSCVTSSLSANGTVIISDGLQSKAFQNEVTLDSFQLRTLMCPGGYRLENIETRGDLWGCVCDNDIDQLLFCRDDQDTIVVESGYWAVYVPSLPHNLEFYPCPAGYCSCVRDDVTGSTGTSCMYMYTNSDPDAQCECHRGGTLCGECVNSSSVTALFSQCSNCTDSRSVLIPALIVVDVVVFAVLIALNIPLPEWSYPFIFYIQLAPYAVEYFPMSFDTVGKYVYFISSASSFYFVYDFCLYDGMSALAGFAMRYLPLLLAVLTLPLVTCIKLYMARRRSIIEHHGLWWIILLTYSHVVYTSMTLLNCPLVTDTNGDTSPRWFMNGEVRCFTGSHVVLGLVAMLMLALIILLIALTAGVTLTWGKYAKPHWISSLRAALSLSFREKCEWWVSVELARRALFLLILITFPRNTAALVIVLSITLAVYGHFQPYKTHLTNVFEIAILTDFLILLLLRENPTVIERYLVFPGDGHHIRTHNGCRDTPDGIATISWILFPFYYAPVLVFTVLVAVYATLAIRKYVKKVQNIRLENDGDHSYSYSHHQTLELNPFTTHASLRVRRGITHGIATVHHKNLPDNALELSERLIIP